MVEYCCDIDWKRLLIFPIEYYGDLILPLSQSFIMWIVMPFASKVRKEQINKARNYFNYGHYYVEVS